MRLDKFDEVSNGVFLKTSEGIMQVTFCAPGIARIRYTLESTFSDKESLMVTQSFDDKDIQFNVYEDDHHLELSTNLLTIRIEKSTCAFTYLDANGCLITKEPSKGGKTLERTDVVRTVFDDTTELQTNIGADGLRVNVDGLKQKVDRQAFHTKLAFEWQQDEALYGLGSHEEGMFNLRGKHQYLYQQNMKAVVPALISTRGYGILIDSYSNMAFRDDAFGSYLWTDTDDEMEFYFIYGPEFDQIIQGVRYLTGEVPMLPKWAFGYIQSKERYVSQQELIDTVKAYRDRNLPLDCIVLDWRSWVGELWGQKTLDPDRFPDPDAMMEDIHALHAKLMVSIWPIMNKGGDNHKEMSENGFLLGNQANYDAFQEEARQLYWKQANEGLFSHGIDAWWCDCTEPFEADWTGAVKPEPEQRMLINTAEAKRYLDPEYINAYSLLHSKGIYEGQRAVTTKKRVVNLTRSSYAGQHRYGTITWSGDIVAKWETLRMQIADGLNFCMTGSPYWTFDIGAFFVQNKPDLWFWDGDYNKGVEDLGYRELYVRWFQAGSFLPMFRSHGTDTPREIWRFGKPGEPMYDTLVKYLKLRYKLMPYIYSMAGAVAHDGYTMFRALPFDFRNDANTYDIDDQFMFGSAFMAAPVMTAMYYGPDSRKLKETNKNRIVYLPSGTWYDYWSDERIIGNKTISTRADLETMPLFVRAGSIVPTGPDIQFTDDEPDATIHLKIYPGTNGSFTLYEDEGDNYNYEEGAYSTIEMNWVNGQRTLILQKRDGSFEGMPYKRQFSIEIAGEINHTVISYSGEQLPVQL
ncbi:TIM-barrel domain-containing protein [Radiobacillus sp. PE A8.2]|uniref:glycoside hydrolase family 31 protein n=1 Tax=Radiobacillus sp. PE A8.2 TaxID=3380349 RepID=UPI003890A15E